MPFEPDIIVSEPEGFGITLVVKVRTSAEGIEELERQLKKYMVGMGSPVGMLVTPEHLWLYRDQYLSKSQDSVAKVGEFDVRNIFRGVPSRDASAFEQQVQSWLEGLSSESGLRKLPPKLRAAAEFYIVPAILHGEIRAGHPRSSLSPS